MTFLLGLCGAAGVNITMAYWRFGEFRLLTWGEFFTWRCQLTYLALSLSFALPRFIAKG